jgi:hypothetical protein
VGSLVLLAVSLDPLIEEPVGLRPLATVVTDGLEEHSTPTNALVLPVQASVHRVEASVHPVQALAHLGKAAPHLCPQGFKFLVHGQISSILGGTVQDVSSLRHVELVARTSRRHSLVAVYGQIWL